MHLLSSLFRSRRGRQVALVAALLASALAVAAQDSDSGPVGLVPKENADEIVGRLAFSDTSLDSVLQTLETLTGRIVIRPQALPSPQLSLNARQPLTRAEAILAIESLLSINGIGVTPLGEKFLKVVPIANIRTEAPELVVGSLKDVPPSGKVVSKLFRLQYLDPGSFQQQAAQFVSGFATIVPFQNSNAVIVTDTIANLQRLEYVVSEVDRRLEIETKFYQINYANATELAEQIRAMIESARSSLAGNATGARVPGPRPAVQPAQGGQGPGGPGAGDGGSLQAVATSSTAITSDERTNQLIVITNPSNLPFFDNLIEKLDVPADPPTEIKVITMKYADAVELASLLSQLISGQSQSARSSDRSGSRRQRSTPFPAIAEQNRQDRENVQRQIRNQVQTDQNSARNAVQAALGDVVEQFSDLMTVIADERTNSIVVSGTKSDIALITRVIGDLDVVLAQVRLEVVIAEVTLSESIQRGIDAFGLVYDQASGSFKLFPRLPGLSTVNSDAATVAGVLSSGGTISNITIDALIASAKGNSSINLLSVPTLTTTHNKEASIILGEARPIVTSTQQSVSIGGGSYSSFQFQDIGIELVVKPVIGPNDVVQLEIDQKVDDIGPNPVTINGEEQPVIIRRQATSYVSVKNNQLVVLGGLQRNSVTKTKNKMWLLGDIPLVGGLFSKKSDVTNRTELLIFIKPEVIRNTDEADQDAREVIRKFNPSDEDARALQDLTGENMTRALEGAPPPEETKPEKVRAPARHLR